MTEAAIDRGVFRDLYVALGEAVGAGGAGVDHARPYQAVRDWIWGGCLLMALGGVLAASDRRYRLGVRPQRASVARARCGARGGVGRHRARDRRAAGSPGDRPMKRFLAATDRVRRA